MKIAIIGRSELLFETAELLVKKGFEIPLEQYFNFKVPNTTQGNNLVEGFLKQKTLQKA